jgi:hypothetical protein
MARLFTALLLALSSCAAPAPSRPLPPPLRARVVYVEPKHDFLVIGKGEPEGLRVGMDFEIVQETSDGPVTLGQATLEKFIGHRGSMSKLAFRDGVISLVKVDDWALYRLRE